MLVLNARFVLLATFSCLSTVTFSPRWGVGAAAIRSRPFGDYCQQQVTSDRPSKQYVLPLPLQSKTVRTHEWLYFNPIPLFADIMFGHLKRDNDTPGVACGFRKHDDDDYRNTEDMARRSVLIPNNHGSEYVVSHSKRPVHKRPRRSKIRMSSGTKEMPLSRRADDGRVGSVAIMSPTSDSAGQQIASLFAVPQGLDTWVLFASEKDKTQFRMIDASDNVESTSDRTPVRLEMGAPGETRTCATYNSSPEQDESDEQDPDDMTMEPCADRATSETGHKSQIFMYNSTSGTLEPTWNSGSDGQAANTTTNSPLNQNSTTSSNATTASSAIQAAATLLANREDISSNSTKQNSTVILVFTPVNSAMIGIQEDSTTTVTKTVTVSNVASTSTAAQAQATVTSSALDVQLVGAPMPSSGVTGSTTMQWTSASTPSSTATGSIDAAAIASKIAASMSASSVSAASPSTPSSTQTAQRRENGKLVASDSKKVIVRTEPYTWMFKAER